VRPVPPSGPARLVQEHTASIGDSIAREFNLRPLIEGPPCGLFFVSPAEPVMQTENCLHPAVMASIKTVAAHRPVLLSVFLLRSVHGGC
jgi:hypothetical protein